MCLPVTSATHLPQLYHSFIIMQLTLQCLLILSLINTLKPALNVTKQTANVNQDVLRDFLA